MAGGLVDPETGSLFSTEAVDDEELGALREAGLNVELIDVV